MTALAFLNCNDLERQARRVLPHSLFSYVSSGSEDGLALQGNLDAYRRWRFEPQVLADVSHRTQRTALFDADYAAPVGIAPMGIAALCHHDGDRKLARAAAALDVPYVLSAASTTPLESVARENGKAWFQAYLSDRWEVIDALAARVWSAGLRTLVVTVDVPVAAIREAELRSGFSVPLKLRPALVAGGLLRPRWLLGTFARTLLQGGIPHFENLTAQRGGPILSTGVDHRASRAGLNWEHIRKLRERWPGRLIIKGILRADDALMARDTGVDGIIVSNHGGRQLDGAVAPLDALPRIVSAVPGLPVMLDGGVRRGTDVLKALALGARLVFIGRPAMYGLACGGQVGVEKVVRHLVREIDIDLALLGCPSTAQLDRSYLSLASRL